MVEVLTFHMYCSVEIRSLSPTTLDMIKYDTIWIWMLCYDHDGVAMMNVSMSIVMNTRYVDLHGLRSLNAIYVNRAWVRMLCTCCDPLEKGGVYDDNVVVVVPL